jgi:hypothetical protein
MIVLGHPKSCVAFHIAIAYTQIRYPNILHQQNSYIYTLPKATCSHK